MIACTAYTDDEFYRKAHLKLKKSCALHDIELYSVKCFFEARGNPDLRQEAYRALIFSMIHSMQAVDDPSEEFILIGCDDTFTRKPDFSGMKFDVGFWLNPELEKKHSTHLFLAAQFVVRRTEAAMNFLNLTLSVMDRFKVNDHRAFHAARMMYYGQYLEADITERMQGVIRRVPSKQQGGRDAT